MVNNDLTMIGIVLDRSGSMDSVKDETISGFNAFIEEQKKVPGEALWSLLQFNDKMQWHTELKSLDTATKLSEKNYQPSGYTALYDAIGTMIDKTGAALAALPEDKRPGKVLIAIMTDGAENASKEYVTRNQVIHRGLPGNYGYGMSGLSFIDSVNPGQRVADMIKHQTYKYGWTFVFLGCDEKSVLDAKQNLGIVYSAAYDQTKTSEAIGNLSARVGTYRSTGKYTG